MDTPTQSLEARQAIYWFRRKQLIATQKLTRINTFYKGGVNVKKYMTKLNNEFSITFLLLIVWILIAVFMQFALKTINYLPLFIDIGILCILFAGLVIVVVGNTSVKKTYYNSILIRILSLTLILYIISIVFLSFQNNGTYGVSLFSVLPRMMLIAAYILPKDIDNYNKKARMFIPVVMYSTFFIVLTTLFAMYIFNNNINQLYHVYSIVGIELLLMYICLKKISILYKQDKDALGIFSGIFFSLYSVVIIINSVINLSTNITYYMNLILLFGLSFFIVSLNNHVKDLSTNGKSIDIFMQNKIEQGTEINLLDNQIILIDLGKATDIDADIDADIGIILCQINGMDIFQQLNQIKINKSIITMTENFLYKYMPENATIKQIAYNKFQVMIMDASPRELEYYLSLLSNNASIYFKDIPQTSYLLSFGHSCLHSTYDTVLATANIALLSNDNKKYEKYALNIAMRNLANSTYESIEHAMRVKDICIKIGQVMNLDNNEMIKLAKLALYHDIGKAQVPLKIINKKGSLSDGEWKIMKNHSFMGYKLSQEIDYLTDISNEILHHHERYDGSGYPDKLSGDDISILNRILVLADVYDSMLHKQSYHAPIAKELVQEEIRLKSSTWFEPKIVKIFFDII